jgi:hypothetical protein
MKRNSGIIGEKVKTTNSTASGVHDLFDQYNAEILENWPQVKEFVSVSPNSGSINEATVTAFTVTTSGFLDGDTLYYSITTGGGVSASDFTGGLSGSFTINSNSGTFNLNPVGSDGSESETFTIEFRLGSSSGQKIGESGTFTIVDASGPTFYWPTSGGSTSSTNYAAAFASYVEFKGNFTQSSNVTYDCMSAWQYFISNVPANPSKFEFYDSTSSTTVPVFTNSDSTQCANLATALRGGSTTSNQGGWYVWLGCSNGTIWNTFVTSYSGSTGGVTNDSTSNSYCRYIGIYPSTSGCVCASGSTRFILRPHIGNSNWGGWSTTCGASTRTMWLRIYT